MSVLDHRINEEGDHEYYCLTEEGGDAQWIAESLLTEEQIMTIIARFHEDRSLNTFHDILADKQGS